MKKFLMLLAIITASAFSAVAAPGDVVGEIYSTDILAYVNGSAISSYNIGGKTVVLAEELCDNNTGKHYGFDCSYDNDTRTLTITSTFTSGNADAKISRGTVGQVLGSVYQTDIKVIFNSVEVTGYNIGGQTAICIEDLGEYATDEHNGQFGYSKYLCNAVWNGVSREITLNTFQQDANYFGTYPSRKLDITLNDNLLSCSFDQLNPFGGNIKFNFSDDFKADVYKIKPVILNNETVGQMVMKPGGMAVFSMNDALMHSKTRELETVLSYGEAIEYVVSRFEVVGEGNSENATIFLAKKDDIHYLLFAMKNGGLVCDSKYGSSYSKVELISENGVPSLKLESKNFAGTMPISTMGYEFSDSPALYISAPLSEDNRRRSRAGIAYLTVDGAALTVPAVFAYGYNSEILVDFEEPARILGLDYSMYGGVFYVNSSAEKHLDTAEFDIETSTIPESVYTLSVSKAIVNGVDTKFTYSENNAVAKEAFPYYYNGRVYVPFSFFQNLYK
ncbi:MAG: hypothetical protein WCX81_00135 [Monoglobales bacterium]